VREQSLAFWLRQRIQNVILLWVGYTRHCMGPDGAGCLAVV
jgi:hypothetical protein